MKTKHAVWLAFFLNLSYAIVEFIAGGILVPVRFLLTLSMILEMQSQLGYQPFLKLSPIVKKTATIPWVTNGLAF